MSTLASTTRIMPSFAAPSFVALETHIPDHAVAPQSWQVATADSKYHWYDLIAGFPEVPDFRDPVGRYLRRMQFELEAVAEKRHIYYVVTRQRARFDTEGSIHWGFFSLKLTLPLLIGVDGEKDSVSFEVKAPFAATLKKPTVTMTPSFVKLNWGGLIEVFSVHDILQSHGHHIKLPSKVIYVGQTRDPQSRLSKASLPSLQKLHQQHSTFLDTLLLIQSVDVTVNGVASADVEPQPAADSDQVRHRMDVVEAALIAYFENPASRQRSHEERSMRRARLAQAQMATNLIELTMDLQLQDAGNYNQLCSEKVAAAPHHRLSCDINDGDMQVAALPLPQPAKAAKSK